MALWMSLEIFDGEVSAAQWAAAYGDALTEAALAGGALDWSWHSHNWGEIFEVEFADEDAWDRYIGIDRLTRARNFTQALQILGANVALTIFPNADHTLTDEMRAAGCAALVGITS